MPEARFTNLMELYEREEDEARRAVGARERERTELLDRAAAIESRRTAASQAVPFELRQQLVRYWSQVGTELQGISKSVSACEEAIVSARAALVEAHRRVATFAKLRERDAFAERRRLERREARRLDEHANIRFGDTTSGQEASA
jgi:flagellar export protein FliJ